jgi:hypothetical protein
LRTLKKRRLEQDGSLLRMSGFRQTVVELPSANSLDPTVKVSHHTVDGPTVPAIDVGTTSHAEVSDDDSTSAVLWTRDPVEVIRAQLEGACVGDDVKFDPFLQVPPAGDPRHRGCGPLPAPSGVDNECRLFSHPMSANVAVHAFPKVEEYIRHYLGSDDVSWADPPDASMFDLRPTSVIGGLIMYSDKSAMTLSASSKSFYPLHITLQCFSADYRQRLIREGDTIVAFLPTSTLWSGDKTGSRDDRMTLLHLCLQEATDPLRRVMLPGLTFRDKDGRLRKMHLCLVNWVTDVPEGKDVAGCLHGNVTARPCAGCLVEANEQSSCVVGRVNWRSFESMQNARDHSAKMHRKADTLRGGIAVRQIRNEAKELLGSLSLSSVPPFIRRWPFVDGKVHPLLDFHRCFGFERMHNLHLGVGRTICLMISERLAEGNSVSTQLVLSAANNLLALTQSTSPTPGARIDFSTAKGSEKLDGLWTKTGLVGMLQAKDMKSVTTVLPFVAALVDRMCGEEAAAPTTRVVVAYTNLCHKITGRYAEGDSGSALDGFTMACLDKLAKDIASFKSRAVDLYGKYQRSGMGTNKFHLLDHVVEDVMRLGSLLLLSADSFESSHKAVKEAFTATSKRNATWMPETLAVMRRHKMYRSTFWMAGRDSGPSQRSLSNTAQEAGLLEANGGLSGGKKDAFVRDSSVLAGKGVMVRLDELRRESMGIPAVGTAVFDTGSLSRRSATADASSRTRAAVLAKELGKLACGTLFEELARLFGSADESPDCASCAENMETQDGLPLVLSGKQVERVNSAHVASIGVPIASSLTSGDNGYVLQIRRHQHRTLQSIVASGCYYNTRRYDNILVDISPPLPADSPTAKGGPPGWHKVRVAKALAFIRVPKLDVRRGFGAVAGNAEYAFVQYYDSVPPIGEVDEALGCVRLRWHKNEHNDPWRALVPMSSVRGKVQVVRGDAGLEDTVARRGLVGWENSFFYVNRYASRSGDVGYDALALAAGAKV